MSYKLKSLLYFTCFVASAFSYYAMDTDMQPKQSKEMVGLVDSELEVLPAEDLEDEDALKY